MSGIPPLGRPGIQGSQGNVSGDQTSPWEKSGQRVDQAGRGAIAGTQRQAQRPIKKAIYIDLSEKIEDVSEYQHSYHITPLKIFLSILIFPILIYWLRGKYTDKVSIRGDLLRQGMQLSSETVPEQPLDSEALKRIFIPTSRMPETIKDIRNQVIAFSEKYKALGYDTNDLVFHVKAGKGGRYSFFYDAGTKDFYIRHKKFHLGGGGYKRVRRLTCISGDGKVDRSLVEIKLKKGGSLEKEKVIDEDDLILKEIREAARPEEGSSDVNAKYIAEPFVASHLRGMGPKGENKHLFIQRRARGDFLQYLKYQRRTLNGIANICERFSEGLKGVAFVHDRGYCHRDIKPENFLVSIKGHLMLADFGFARKPGRVATLSGTKGYIPEKEEPYFVNQSDDIYALGIMCLDMADDVYQLTLYSGSTDALEEIKNRLQALGEEVTKANERDRMDIHEFQQRFNAIKDAYISAIKVDRS